MKRIARTRRARLALSLVLTISALAVVFPAQAFAGTAPPLQWQRQHATSPDARFGDVVVDADDNLFVLEEQDFGMGSAIRKYDSSGDFEWQVITPVTDTLEDRLAIDPNTGDLYIAGYTRQDLDGGEDRVETDAYVVKYDSDGNEVWRTRFGTDTHDYVWALGVDGAGDVYVGGSTEGAFPGFTNAGGGATGDSFVGKLDKDDHSLSWTRQWGDAEWEEVYGIESYDDATNGGVYASGYDCVDSGDSIECGATLTKLDIPDGDVQWADDITPTNDFGDAFGMSVSVDQTDGTAYLNGWTDSDLTANSELADFADVFAAGYTHSGTRSWLGQFDLNEFDLTHEGSSDLDPSGDLYIAAATFTEEDDWQASTIKVTSAGELDWQQDFGTPQADEAHDVAIDSTGAINIGGFTRGDLQKPNGGGGDGFLRRLGADNGPRIHTSRGVWGLQDTDIDLVASVEDFTDGGFTTEWSVVEGGSPCTFADESAPATTITCTEDGTYTARLTADDNVNDPVTKDVRVSVRPPASIAAHQQRTEADNAHFGEVAVDGDANLFVLEEKDGTATAVRKYDSAGAFVGEVDLPVTDSFDERLAVDGNGNVIVAGYSTQDVELPNAPQGDAFVVKYDNDLVESWRTEFGTADWDYVWALGIDDAGDIYVGGSTEGAFPGFTNPNPQSTGDAYVTKIDTDTEDLLWTQQFGGGDWDETYGLEVFDHATNGGVYASGYRCVPAGSSTECIATLTKFDVSDGDVQWRRRIHPEAADGDAWGNSVSVDQSTGAAYLNGWTDSDLPRGGTIDNTNPGDVFAARYSHDGSRAWLEQAYTPTWDTSEEGSSVLDTAGNLYVAGSVIEDDGQASLLKFTPDGELDWRNDFGTASTEEGRDVAIDETNDLLYVVGGTNGDLGGTNGGGEDGFITTISENFVDPSPVVDAGDAPDPEAEGESIPLDGDVSDLTAGVQSTWSVESGVPCTFEDASDIDTYITCTDDSGTSTFTATLTADDGINDPVSDTVAVAVQNAVPLVDITIPPELSMVAIGGSVTATASIFDMGEDDVVTCDFDFGDGGTQNDVAVDGNGVCTSTAHTYTAAGDFPVAVVATDDDGGSGFDEVVVGVRSPDLKKTTGSGTTSDGTFKHTVSFNRKTGAVTGSLTFTQVGTGFRFTSGSIGTLAPGSSLGTAVFRGTGTWRNNSVRFVATAVDGVPDRFGLVISHISNGTLQYSTFTNNIDQTQPDPLTKGRIANS